MAATDDRRARPAPADDELAALQSILIGPAARQLDLLQARLDDPAARAADVAGVLPRVLVTHADDPDVTRALTPAVERAITTSVRRNPRPLADALFPIMGPAIRKAVSASLASVIESVNRTLEHALSWRSLQWRLDALRTHRSFAEIVLARTLLYRVEQLFLIDRRTGLLLLHVQPGSAAVADADMVSGMLTAIRDFVQDSFRVSSADSLEALEVGDLSVWIEQGPRALLAAVIRGAAPRDLRTLLQEAIEEVHRRHGRALEAFRGDAAPFEDARPILETCLTSEYRKESRPRRGAWILFGAIAALLLVWVGLSYRSAARLAAYLDVLAAEPGLTVISAERGWRRHAVTGLRDPLARDPETLLASAALAPGSVDGRWTPYQSLEPALVIRRAQQILQPPAGATLTLGDGILGVVGPVTPAWIEEARRLAPLIGGISSFDAAGAARAAMKDVRARVEGIVLLFEKGTSRFVAGQEAVRARMLATLTDLDALARAAGQPLTVVLIGHTDEDGDEASNVPLSRARAEAARATIAARSFTHLSFDVDGAGSREPAVRGSTEDEYRRNRRITLRVSGPQPR